MSTKVVSRDELFNSEPSGDELPYEEGVHDDFDIVQVEQQEEANNKGAEDNGNDPEEYAFPLFSFGAGEEATKEDKPLMKVSLKVEEEELVQERPKSYYYQHLSEECKDALSSSALTYDDIFTEKNMRPYQGWKKFRGKVIDVADYNRIVDANKKMEIKNKKRRPGKKQRIAKALGSKRVKEREEKDKELKKQRKKMFHKRGGKKNKKKASTSAIPSKPKFRTE
ncbi:Fungal protein of unknown function (DUF2011) [Nakaseomyces glabratus]|nr:Fungal protein of unknown function (DUF2011) [Nakaseomyces glabratus]KAH7588720.1 Fungal protein of unknown function (DUF2011) [Nakaseomyces glabratus]KAH7593134.1 Fungal protein of unknown function (DUF2011) [Nakaseomyces glabratus]KAH7602170.1 Fungal protein of unknown function (DUF2011) [Nakaseomyces glabratus]KAH7613560.1 Fungal protein of unknown function (DUF2011) [Nakaseomyces glabratus]